jgi:ketosteroid isomerase-like protein
MSDAVDRLVAFFSDYDPSAPPRLDGLYAEAIEFRDPLHAIDGREALAAYFARLNRGASAVRFDFHQVLRDGDTAALFWTMTVVLKTRRSLQVEGASRIAVRDDRVVRHTDFFDAGALVYEQVPGLSLVIKGIKRLM